MQKQNVAMGSPCFTLVVVSRCSPGAIPLKKTLEGCSQQAVPKHKERNQEGQLSSSACLMELRLIVLNALWKSADKSTASVSAARAA
jgi:hypothetical protein